ncbi:Potassium channel domain-containing protein [Caenorhabditis elegans]|uniref:Potassium channel domain-containing protein n=1 Tax=Caenorhabditis elegans TaxID=6239 RepID=Q21529_CAEEL|nr:Potassium channel domain-containing protein [Caenorhabditis elegans]CAA90259.1 Potassium channel domain-containing protein [Caenorhabditis elegans]|eukprot:NP_495727.1 TWiK family of potassium channels [Caenorhabditis elegans]
MTVSMEENSKIQMLSATSKDKKVATDRSLLNKYHLGPLALHTGLVLSCVTYALGGAYLFLSIEHPEELKRREKAIREFQDLKQQFMGNITSGIENSEQSIEIYTKKLILMLEDAHNAHAFEYFFLNHEIPKDMWTFSSALVFTTTTVIPVGYGYIFPVSAYGRMCLIAYALLGIPLTLVTMADTGKFAAQLVTRWFGDNNMAIPAAIFVCLLFAYPLVVGFILCSTSNITYLDSVYFSLTSIFTIGFGDLTPDMNVIHMVLFLAVGVILVTITLDIVAAEMIDRVHYMGRHVGKAKELAGKMFQLAQSLNMKQGLVSGVGQLHALARFGMLVGREEVDKTQEDGIIAFSPDVMDGLEFMDTLSIYSRRSRRSAENSARNLFLS